MAGLSDAMDVHETVRRKYAAAAAAGRARKPRSAAQDTGCCANAALDACCELDAKAECCGAPAAETRTAPASCDCQGP